MDPNNYNQDNSYYPENQDYYQNYAGYDYTAADPNQYYDYSQYYQQYQYPATGAAAAPQEVIPAVPTGYDQGSYVPPHEQAKAIRDKKKKATVVRKAAGQTWEDNSLLEWDSNDYRIFAGDLGNEVNDDMLSKAFSKYPTFLKAKVIYDKRSGKSKGYGFVSFKDVGDFVKASKEMNGKYIGNRPCKLRKSTWKDRNVGCGKKKK